MTKPWTYRPDREPKSTEIKPHFAVAEADCARGAAGGHDCDMCPDCGAIEHRFTHEPYCDDCGIPFYGEGVESLLERVIDHRKGASAHTLPERPDA